MTQLIDLGKLRFFFAGEWDAASQYEANDVVRYGGHLYVYTAVVASTGNLPTDATRWQVMVRGLNFRGTYVPATAYRLGDVVTYGPVAYVALVDATGVTPAGGATWGALTSGIRFLGAYAAATAYVPGDLVSFGNGSYVAVAATTGNLPVDATKWAALTAGFSLQGAYVGATTYHLGDVVSYGGRTYRALGETTGNLPSDATKWALHQDGQRHRGDWVAGTDYLPNDVVQRGASAYVATAVHTAAATFAADAARWAKRTPGFRWRGVLATTTAYLADDVVFDGIHSYVATADFTSTSAIAADHAALAMLAKGVDNLPSQVGQGGKVLGTNGTAVSWVSVREAWKVVAADYTAVAGDCLLADTSAGSFVVTLPPTPTVGDKIRFIDLANTFATKNLWLARNGSLIERLPEPLGVDANTPFDVVYSGSTYGWKVL